MAMKKVGRTSPLVFTASSEDLEKGLQLAHTRIGEFMARMTVEMRFEGVELVKTILERATALAEQNPGFREELRPWSDGERGVALVVESWHRDADGCFAGRLLFAKGLEELLERYGLME